MLSPYPQKLKIAVKQSKPHYCLHGCQCPKCGAYLEIEMDTLAHYCLVCKDYQLPKGGCPEWGITHDD